MQPSRSSFAASPLARIGWRTLLRRPWQSVLMILGIALGVSVVIAIDIANVSARGAFELSTETVTGKATHQIVEDLQASMRTTMPGCAAWLCRGFLRR